MKLLAVVASVNPATGGVIESIRQTASVHADMGHETEIVSIDAADAPWVQSERQCKVHALGPGQWGWGYSPRLVPWLQEHASDFDAIIVHGLWLFPSFAVWYALRNAPDAPPYYVMPHGMMDPWFQRLDVRPLKSLRNSLYWRLVEHRVLRDAVGVLYTCEEERRLAGTTFRPYGCKELIVTLGTRPPPPYRSKLKECFEQVCPGVQSRSYLLFLGRVDSKKGVDLLLRAYLDLCRKEGELPADLVVAGPLTDTRYEYRLKTILKCATSAMQSRIHFPGMLTGDAKWGAYYGCEAFVLPSHQENFGFSIVEALACGKPVLITDKVNIWRELESGGCCLKSGDNYPAIVQLMREWFSMSAAEKDKLRACSLNCFNALFHHRKAAESILNAIATA